MIKVNTDKGGVELEMSGTLEELSADAAVILQAIYTNLEERDILTAILFRNNVCNHIFEGRTMRTVVEGEDVR